MPWDELFWMFVLLTVVAIFGQLWFHLVDSLLERAKRLLFRRGQPPVWHTLPGEKEDDAGHQ